MDRSGVGRSSRRSGPVLFSLVFFYSVPVLFSSFFLFLIFFKFAVGKVRKATAIPTIVSFYLFIYFFWNIYYIYRDFNNHLLTFVCNFIFIQGWVKFEFD